MKLNFLNAILTGCLLFSLNACERDQNSESNAELSADLESLEKELAQLESRVNLLEDPDAE